MNYPGKDTIIRKGATGSAALAIVTVIGDGVGLLLSVATGGILIPWLVAVVPWLAGAGLNHLHHDLWLFLLLILLLLLLVITGISYLGDQPGYASLKHARAKRFGEALGGGSVLLGIIWLFCEWIFQIHVTLGFIRTIQLGAFPNLVYYAKHFNQTLAIVWVAYYLGVHLLCLLRPAMEKDGQIPLSHPATDGRREKYVRQCYQHLKNALLAWDPPPYEAISLPKFAYYQGQGSLLWKGSTLLISERLIDPAQAGEFLPALAKEIAHFNGPARWLTPLMNSYPQTPGLMFFLAITGNWLWFPSIIRTDWWEHWQHEQKLDIDAFVHFAGQSAWLLHDLRRQYYEIQNAGLIDTSSPTLNERIDHLEALMDKEELQMKNQNIKPAPAQIPGGRQAAKTKRLKQGTGEK